MSVTSTTSTTRSPLLRTAATGLAALAVAAVPLLVAPAAQASGGSGAVEARGTCTGGGTWKLKAKPDDGRIEVEYEVDTNVAGQTWSVTVTDNAATVFAGSARTLAPSGSFSRERTTANQAGADVVRARATFGSRVCSGSVTL